MVDLDITLHFISIDIYINIKNVLIRTLGMTRGPCVRFPNAKGAVELKEWLQDPNNYKSIEKTFSSTSRFARLVELKCTVAGRFP